MEGYDFAEYAATLHRGPYYHNIRHTPWYGDAVYTRFSTTEYARRHELARQKMRHEGYDCLIVPGGQATWSQGGALTWLTGLVDRRAMAQYLVLPAAEPPLLAYAMGGAHAELARLWTGMEVQPARRGDFAAVIAARVQALGLGRGRLAVLNVTSNPGVEWPPDGQLRNLATALPEAQIDLVAGWFHEWARVKSDEEIEAYAAAGSLAVAAWEAMAAAARPGLTEHQLSGAAVQTILAAEGRPDFVRVAATPAARPRVTVANPLPSDRPLRAGDLVLLEVSALRQGVTAQVGGALCLGPAPPVLERFWNDVARPGLDALESALVPDAPLTAIQRAGRFFRRQGVQSAPLLLHGLDIEASRPRVFVHEIQADPGDETLLPGMVVVVRANPLRVDGRWGVCLSRTYALTESGRRLLTDLTPVLHVT